MKMKYIYQKRQAEFLFQKHPAGSSIKRIRPFHWAFLLLAVWLSTDCESSRRIFTAIADAATPPDLQWASRRDLNSDEFSQRFDEYKNRGWIIKDVDAYPHAGGLQYSMIWEENTDNRGWYEWRNLSDASYHEKWQEYRDKGYRPTDVEAYPSGNSTLYAGIWEENKEGLAWFSYRNQTDKEFSDRFDEKSNSGFRLVDVEAYQTPGGLLYASIWQENKNNIEWREYRDMTREKYQERIDGFSADGFRVIDFESYTNNGQQRYAAIWEKNLFDHATVVRSDRTEIQYANYWRLYRDLGYRLVDFERYDTPEGVRYAGVWTENSPRFRWGKRQEMDGLTQNYRDTNDVTGISVAIIHRGKLVYQRGFGMAEIDQGKEAHGRSVYNTASVSKIIGGTLAAKMESEGRLADGTTVSLDLTAPTTNYLDIPASGHTHTVQQLLSHLGCIWHYSTGTTPGGHYNTAQDAVENMWNASPLSGCTIGTNRNYSTHAFTFVGAVLENVSGRSIARLVEEEIAQRYNFSSMRVQYRNNSLPPDYERAAPYNDNGNETGYDDSSWKVLGGGIETDAVDLAWFGWKTLNGEIVSAATRDNRLWTRVNPNQRNGLAWELNNVGGRRMAEHGGSWSGARSHLRVYRDAGDELVIAILSNKRGHDPADLATVIGNAILD